MSATRSISDLELPVDEEQRHAMPHNTKCEPFNDEEYWARVEENQRWQNELSFEEQRKEQEEAQQAQQREQAYLEMRASMKQRCDELTVATSKAAHRAGRAAAELESLTLTHEHLEDPVQILSDPLEDEQMAYHKRNYEDAVDAIRLHLSREFLQDPIRIRPEPADRNLAQETEDNEKLIEHHQRRCDEEVASIRSKFACHRERARCAMYAELDRHEKFCRRSSEWEALKIRTIEKRRAELAWTCPNDGQAYPFTFKGWRYHRTYLGETWLSENWTWMGYWVGYYIKSGKPPHDDEVSDKIREALKQ